MTTIDRIQVTLILCKFRGSSFLLGWYLDCFKKFLVAAKQTDNK